jgi:hypothetical protein
MWKTKTVGSDIKHSGKHYAMLRYGKEVNKRDGDS